MKTIYSRFSDANKTFWSRHARQDFTRTTTAQITIRFCNGHKMNPTVYTQSDTTQMQRRRLFLSSTDFVYRGTTTAYPALAETWSEVWRTWGGGVKVVFNPMQLYINVSEMPDDVMIPDAIHFLYTIRYQRYFSSIMPISFFAVPSKMWNLGGGRRGTHCIREFQYLTHGFCVYIVDFVDFNI